MIRLLDLIPSPHRVLRASRYPPCGVIGMQAAIGRREHARKNPVSVVRLVLFGLRTMPELAGKPEPAKKQIEEIKIKPESHHPKV